MSDSRPGRRAQPLPPEAAAWLRTALATESLLAALHHERERADAPGSGRGGVVRVDGLRSATGTDWVWRCRPGHGDGDRSRTPAPDPGGATVAAEAPAA